MIQTYTFTALQKGPRILIFGSIHGNEVCGPRAITRIMRELETGTLKLQKGSVTFVPVCNPEAAAKHVRYVEENLNRIFKPTKKPTSYEARLANTLTELVNAHDTLLDIHSTTAKGVPFMYLDFPTVRNKAWAHVLGPKVAVVGWPELYKTLGKAHTSFDTTTYAHSQHKDTLLVECGQHEASTAEHIAYQAIRRTLAHYQLVHGGIQKQTVALVHIDRAFFRNEGEALAKPAWKHLDRVKKGVPLIVTPKGVITAPYDCYIVMPKHNAPVGHDWLYIGRSA